jgi:hypothetical protein
VALRTMQPPFVPSGQAAMSYRAIDDRYRFR